MTQGQRRRSGIEAVLFDMDGTLVDTDEHWHAAEVATFAHYDVPWTDHDHAALLGVPVVPATQYMLEKLGGARTFEEVSTGHEGQRIAGGNLFGGLGRADERDVDREDHHQHPEHEGQVRQDGQKGATLNHGGFGGQYWTFFSTNRNWITVSAMTTSMRMTDWAAEPPMSSALKPS